MQLFFSNTVENQVIFTSEENKHLTKVLRKKINDELFIIDGKRLFVHWKNYISRQKIIYS